MDRRLFTRSSLEVDGELSYTVRRFGREKTRTIPVKTVDLSVDGAQVKAEQGHPLRRGDPCRISFRGVHSAASVLAIIEEPDGFSRLRLGLRHPSAEYLAAVEHWLPTEFPDARPAMRTDWAAG